MFFTGLEFPKVSGSVQFHRQLDVVTVRVFVAEKKFPKITTTDNDKVRDENESVTLKAEFTADRFLSKHFELRLSSTRVRCFWSLRRPEVSSCARLEFESSVSMDEAANRWTSESENPAKPLNLVNLNS